MIHFVFLICPSLLSMLILWFINKNTLKKKTNILFLGILLGSLCALNNMLSLFLIRIIWKVDAVTIIDYVSIKYLFIALCVSIIMAFLLDVINKYFSINIMIETNEEK